MVPLKSEIGRGYLTALGKPKSGWELVGWKQLSHEGTLIPSGPYQLVHHLPPWARLFSIYFMTSEDTWILRKRLSCPSQKLISINLKHCEEDICRA